MAQKKTPAGADINPVLKDEALTPLLIAYGKVETPALLDALSAKIVEYTEFMGYSRADVEGAIRHITRSGSERERMGSDMGAEFYSQNVRSFIVTADIKMQKVNRGRKSAEARAEKASTEATVQESSPDTPAI